MKHAVEDARGVVEDGVTWLDEAVGVSGVGDKSCSHRIRVYVLNKYCGDGVVRRGEKWYMVE